MRHQKEIVPLKKATAYKEVDPLTVPERVRRCVETMARRVLEDLRLPPVEVRWFKKCERGEKVDLVADETTVSSFAEDNPRVVWLHAELNEEEAAVLIAETLHDIDRFRHGLPLADVLSSRYARGMFYKIFGRPANYGFKEGDLQTCRQR